MKLKNLRNVLDLNCFYLFLIHPLTFKKRSDQALLFNKSNSCLYIFNNFQIPVNSSIVHIYFSFLFKVTVLQMGLSSENSGVCYIRAADSGSSASWRMCIEL